MTAVKIPECRTASTATTHPRTYSTAKTPPSSLPPLPASNAKPIVVKVTAIRIAAHHGTPGRFGCAER